ncbi:hypothetical protein M9H77_33855 [Catharanthus roseus]|uniref:Uncharacterized protein n=1 Tax=Catharanthus roseus TaxID=4058 RepID=A0ACB9ZKA8_CATRO|nr:hypothetical protein M9H77_33855 [Catharanthus roseus]
MTDIQLGTRFIDKVQAIEQNKHRNLSSKFISMSISHLVANDPEILVSNIIQEVEVLYQTGCTYKRAWYARKFAIERVFGYWDTTFSILPKYLQAVQDINPGTSRTDAYVPKIYSRQTYRKAYKANFHPVLSENF